MKDNYSFDGEKSNSAIRKQRVNDRYIKLERNIKDLFYSFEYESFTDSKEMLCEEIIRKVKSANIFSHFGGKYKSIINIDPLDNYIIIDVRDKHNFRLMKYNFFL